MFAILPDEIETFAESLFYKRLSEVENLLPHTREILTGKFEANFSDFAGTFVPISVKKHLEDAIQFCGYFLENVSISAEAKDSIRLEQAKLEFYGCGKNFVIRRIRSASKNEKKASKRTRFWVRLWKKEFIR